MPGVFQSSEFQFAKMDEQKKSLRKAKRETQNYDKLTESTVIPFTFDKKMNASSYLHKNRSVTAIHIATNYEVIGASYAAWLLGHSYSIAFFLTWGLFNIAFIILRPQNWTFLRMLINQCFLSLGCATVWLATILFPNVHEIYRPAHRPVINTTLVNSGLVAGAMILTISLAIRVVSLVIDTYHANRTAK